MSIINEKFRIALIGVIGSLILRLLNFTLRWEMVGLSGDNRSWASGNPRIIAFWHGRQLFMPWLYRNFRVRGKGRPFYMLISNHSDGQIISHIVRWLGIRSVAGSSSHGGAAAIFHLIDKLAQGCHIGITPDGPRGPKYKLKPGIVRIAQRSGVAVYPAAISAENKWSFGSWDGMILPKPFSRSVVVLGEPVFVPAEAKGDELAAFSERIEDALNDVTRTADEHSYS